MRIPIFTKIEIRDFSLENIRLVFEKSHVGELPTYFEVDMANSSRAKEALSNIKLIFEEFCMHPRFPFPTYIICPSVSHFEDLLLIQDELSLPRHFLKKDKKLKPKELSLLNKVSILATKIGNMPIQENGKALENEKSKSRELSKLTKEAVFLEKVIKKLRKI